MPGPNRFTEGLLEKSDITASSRATNGEIRFNLGDSTKGTGIDRNVPFFGIDGFLSRPNDPDSLGAAQVYFAVEGDERIAIGTRDRRYLSTLEPLDPGDRMIHSPIGVRLHFDDSEQQMTCTIPEGSTFYLAPNQFRVSIASGTAIDAGLSSVDVTKLGVAEPVALYGRLQTLAFTLNAYVVAAHVILVKIPVPPTVPELAALNTAYTAFLNAVIAEMNPLLASSSVLRASPT